MRAAPRSQQSARGVSDRVAPQVLLQLLELKQGMDEAKTATSQPEQASSQQDTATGEKAVVLGAEDVQLVEE